MKAFPQTADDDGTAFDCSPEIVPTTTICIIDGPATGNGIVFFGDRPFPLDRE